MTYPTPFTIGVRAHSTTGSDGFGNPTESWATAVNVSVYGVAPGTPGEDYEPGRVASRIPLIVLGPTAVLGGIGARDRVVWGGVEYEVDGVPEVFDVGPFGFEPGSRLRIVRVEG